MDGILADFQSSILRLIGRRPPLNYSQSDGDLVRHFGISDEFVKEHLDYDFWATIPPTDIFDDVISTVEGKVGRSNTYIISTMYDVRGCMEGKRLWIEKFLGRGYPSRLYFVAAKSEQARNGAMLVDDSSADCKEFFDDNGHAFLMPRPWNAAFERQREWKTLLNVALDSFLTS